MLINESLILNSEYYNEELALAYLLVMEVCHLNTVVLKDGTFVVTAYVNCNDVFYYSTADAEYITSADGEEDSEIIALYKMIKENPMYGAVKFCALRRQMLPLKEIVEEMKRHNYWDQNLKKLENEKI